MATEFSSPPNRSSKANNPAKAAIAQFVVEKAAAKLNQKTGKLNEQVNRKADRVAHKADRVARQAAHHLDTLDRLAAHLEALDVWTRSEPTARKPRFSRDEIAAVAIQIADAEGFDAVSMRRIATELDAGTMTLYHYVRTKDQLLALVIDTIMTEVIVPHGDLPSDWREAIKTIARRSRDSLLRHPWILDISDDPNLGPNSVRHFDQTLQAVAPLKIDLREKLDIVTAVDEYVFGYCQHMRTQVHEGIDGIDAMRDYVVELVETGDYPQLAAVIAETGVADAWNQIVGHASDTDRFDRNLARLLDGFEADLVRRGVL